MKKPVRSDLFVESPEAAAVRKSFIKRIIEAINEHAGPDFDEADIIASLLHGAAAEAARIDMNGAKFASAAHRAYKDIFDALALRSFDKLATDVLRKDPK